jgi:MFS family permease
LPLSLFGRRLFATGALSSLFAYAALFTATSTLPSYLVDLQQRRLVDAGLVVGVVPVALALSAPLSGWIADRAGARGVCTVGLAAVAAGMLGATLLPAHASLGWLVLLLALVGAGVGAYESPNSAASLGALPSDDFGVGSAVMGVSRTLGMTLGAAAAGVLLGGRGGHGRALELASVHQAFAVAAALALAAALVRAQGKARPRRR